MSWIFGVRDARLRSVLYLKVWRPEKLRDSNTVLRVEIDERDEIRTMPCALMQATRCIIVYLRAIACSASLVSSWFWVTSIIHYPSRRKNRIRLSMEVVSDIIVNTYLLLSNSRVNIRIKMKALVPCSRSPLFSVSRLNVTCCVLYL